MSFVSVSEYLRLPRAPEAWVVTDLLPSGGLLNIYGRPKTGKSFLALQMAAAIANPYVDSFLGLPVKSHGPVMYLQIDTARGTWADRIVENFLEHGIHLPEAVHLADAASAPYPFNILHNGRGFLRENCDRIRPVAVVIDTIREAHRGDENDSAAMQAAISTLVEATQPAALVILSHSRKNKPDDAADDLMAEGRGSNYLPGRADCILRVTSNSRIDYQGRTVEFTSMDVTRDDKGLYQLSHASDAAVARILKEFSPAQHSQKEMAIELQKILPSRTVEACRSLIRRGLQQQEAKTKKTT